jgi:tetratricopeptide (TPR) repeat protein
MKLLPKLVYSLLFVFFMGNSFAQTAAQLHETAQAFMRQGDYSNAILVLNRSLEKSPNDITILKDLAQSFFLQQNTTKAIEMIKPLLDHKDADDQCFLLAGNIYKQTNNLSESEKIFKKAIKKFPESGALYNELGEIQIANKSKESIVTWEKGIQADPSYSRNYFNAAKYYFYNEDKVWCLLYGENFINMEPNGSKTAEMKQILLAGYKKMFSETNLEKSNKNNSAFTVSFLKNLNKQSNQAAQGISVETLSIVRTRFILDWFSENNKPAYKLFEYQQQLLREGLFEAYNQWVFGASDNIAAYQDWIKNNAAENTAFVNMQRSRIFKIPAAQYYK